MLDDKQFTRRMPVATEASDGPVEMSVDGEDAFAVAEAVGSETRWQLLAAIAEEPHTLDELVERLDLTKGTISVHISRFEEVGIFTANYNVSADGGVKKEIALAVDEVTLDLTAP
jgi:predicted transcriptional regulator